MKDTVLIYFSSSYVYSGLSLKETVNEETILNPKHNFGFAKFFFENMIKRITSNYIVFRLSSVFGEGNYLHPNAIENLVKEAIFNKSISVWGTGKRRMQYIYLKNIHKYLLRVESIPKGIYNLCGDNYNNINYTAKIIANFFKVNHTKFNQ